MEENFNNKISRLELENFTCFAKAEMDFSSGINVFIGENGTGKTHILKVLYAMLYDNVSDYFLPSVNTVNATFDNATFNSDSQTNTIALKNLERIHSHFYSYFKPQNNLMGRLIRQNNSTNKWRAEMSLNDDKSVELQFQTSSKKGRSKCIISDDFLFHENCLFIPSNEMLTLYRGFISSYEKRENSFDGTHYNLAKALDLLPLTAKGLNGSEILLEEFNREVGIQVYKKDGQFYLKFKDGLEVEAPLAAEGLKKLAQMIYLIQNGSLNKDTILFWDEPETNLNPKYIKIVAKFLQVLAKNGVQIFVATHDYLLTNLLSLSAEYPKKDTPPMRFFSLSKGESGTEIEFANTIHGIQNNAILDEFADYSELMLNSQIQKLQNA
jgi:predicted ATPase